MILGRWVSGLGLGIDHVGGEGEEDDVAVEKWMYSACRLESI